jgi:hypothetical protein
MAGSTFRRGAPSWSAPDDKHRQCVSCGDSVRAVGTSRGRENKRPIGMVSLRRATTGDSRMRTLPLLAALALFGLVQPASAQMCGASGQQAQASTPAQGGMMCGGMGAAAEDDPMADKPSQPQRMGGMCPCCRNMAMMRGGGSSGGGMQHDNMPGMSPPKQQ